MRVISGRLRGKKIETPKSQHIRPTMDRIKETLFNIIQVNVVGSDFLDLFAGTGSIGIEAVSRGAENVVFCDSNRDSLRLLKTNLANLAIDAQVFECDFKLALNKQLQNSFDIIYLDPPFGKKFGQAALEIIGEKGLLKQEGMVIFEHNSTEEVPDTFSGLKKNRTKKMGSVTFSFFGRSE